jgi:hypothetical protein
VQKKKKKENSVHFILQRRSVATMDDFMKLQEQQSLGVTHVHAWDAFVVRLDGRAFSVFTKQTFGALSKEFKAIMVETARRLMAEFCAGAAATHSDEITLLFPPLCTQAEATELGVREPQRMWSGRTMKMATVMASFAASVFTVSWQKYLGRCVGGIYLLHVLTFFCWGSFAGTPAGRGKELPLGL